MLVATPLSTQPPVLLNPVQPMELVSLLAVAVQPVLLLAESASVSMVPVTFVTTLQSLSVMDLVLAKLASVTGLPTNMKSFPLLQLVKILLAPSLNVLLTTVKLPEQRLILTLDSRTIAMVVFANLELDGSTRPLLVLLETASMCPVCPPVAVPTPPTTARRPTQCVIFPPVTQLTEPVLQHLSSDLAHPLLVSLTHKNCVTLAAVFQTLVVPVWSPTFPRTTTQVNSVV